MESWQEAFRGMLPDELLDNLSIEVAEKHWQERLRMSLGEILVVEEAGAVIGFGVFGLCYDSDIEKEPVGEVFMMYLHPKHWHKGHGAALMRSGLGYLQAKACREVVLWVMEENQQAIHFYEAAGFHDDGSMQVRKRAYGAEMHLRRYRRSLIGQEQQER